MLDAPVLTRSVHTVTPSSTNQAFTSITLGSELGAMTTCDKDKFCHLTTVFCVAFWHDPWARIVLWCFVQTVFCPGTSYISTSVLRPPHDRLSRRVYTRICLKSSNASPLRQWSINFCLLIDFRCNVDTQKKRIRHKCRIRKSHVQSKNHHT